jgi:hypothetical protein
LIQVAPSKNHNEFDVTSNTCKPAAGEGIPNRWIEVSLGNNIPLFKDCTSNMAELSGVLVPIPTCAYNGVLVNKRMNE